LSFIINLIFLGVEDINKKCHRTKKNPFAAITKGLKCPEWESNPYALKDTWPSTMPVYQFQHLGKDFLEVQI